MKIEITLGEATVLEVTLREALEKSKLTLERMHLQNLHDKLTGNEDGSMRLHTRSAFARPVHNDM
jgi:hypothetical protein